MVLGEELVNKEREREVLLAIIEKIVRNIVIFCEEIKPIFHNICKFTAGVNDQFFSC